MNISVDKNREINISGENEKGTQNENLIQSLTLQVPEEYSGYNKKIVFIINGTEILWDLFDENDTYVLGTAITQYESVDYYIWLTHEDKDFRTKTRTLYFNQNKDASGQITPEEISGVNTVIALLEEEITKVDNIDIVATKENQVTTITITDKNGESHSVEILDGIDGEDGKDAKINGYNTLTMQGGTNISIEQEGSTLTINNTYEYDDSEIKGDISTIEGDISNINTELATKITKDVNNLTYYTKTSDMNTAINNAVNTEKTLRENSDTNLQSQIDAITSASDVVDIVGTYQELQQYDTSKLTEDDVIKVLQDSTHSNALSYFRWKNNQWNYVGSEGPFYTKGETDALLNAKQNEIDSTHKLNADLVDDSTSTNKFVTASDKTNWNSKVDEEDIADFVKNTDYATSTKAGLIKPISTYAIADNVNNGVLYAQIKTYEQYSSGANEMFIGKGTLENVITGKELINATQLEESQQPQDESIAEMQEILSNIPTTTGTGEEITIDNTMKCKHTADELGGNTSQETTEGYNKIALLDKESTTINGITYKVENGILTLSGTASDNTNILIYCNDITLPSGTYKFYLSKNTSNRVDISVRTTNNAMISSANFGNTFTQPVTNRTFTLDTDTLIHSINFWFPNGVTATDTFKVMISTDSHTADEYEPYTNGASPNPSYPSPVNVVKGENTVSVCGKNIFDDSVITNLWSNYETQQIITVNGTNLHKYNCKYGDAFSLSATFETASGNGAILIQFFDKNDNNLGRYAISNNTTVTLTKTAPENTSYAYIGRYLSTPTSIQLEKNSQVTDYEQYQGQNYPIDLIGKNKFNPNVERKNAYPKADDSDVGKVVSYNNSSATYSYVNCAYVKAGQPYTISWTQSTSPASTNTRIGVIVDDNNIVLQKQNTWYNSANVLTFTPSYSGYLILATDINTTNIQVEKGSTATTYEEFWQIELAKIGNYQDKLFKAIVGDVVYDSLSSSQKEGLNSGSWYKYGIDKIVLNGTENWQGASSVVSGTSRFYYDDNKYMNNNVGSAVNVVSDKFKAISWQQIYADDTTTKNAISTWASNTYEGRLIIRIDNTFANSLTTFKSWLASNNVTVYYVPATPTFTEITDTTLIEQLENWRNSKSYNGQTNITQTNDDKAFVISYTTLKEFTEGTITSIKMNNTVKGTSGEVDLGTVITQHQDISGKLNTSKVKSSQSTTSGDVYDVTYINSMLGNIETLLGGI